jgi:hypothetical protein
MRWVLQGGFILLFLIHFPGLCQQVTRDLSGLACDTAYINRLKKEFGNRKKIPQEIESSVLCALSFYPELKNIKIDFRIRRSKSALLAKPTLFSAFFRQPAKRNYIIVVSKQPCKYLEHIQFHKLPVNGQIGVLGHELAHVSDFTQRNAFGFMEIALGNLSPGWLDRYEYATDQRTIDHGLGYQLLAWSNAVRDILQVRKYLGGYDVKEEHITAFQESERERYMNPSTIIKKMENHPLYSDTDETLVE